MCHRIAKRYSFQSLIFVRLDLLSPSIQTALIPFSRHSTGHKPNFLPPFLEWAIITFDIIMLNAHECNRIPSPFVVDGMDKEANSTTFTSNTTTTYLPIWTRDLLLMAGFYRFRVAYKQNEYKFRNSWNWRK